MCSVNLKYVSPGWVRSESGAWHVVIQSLQWDIAQVGSDNLTSKLNFILDYVMGEGHIVLEPFISVLDMLKCISS